jgi:4-hydroxy-tetrahydrodipicolinate synthase
LNPDIHGLWPALLLPLLPDGELDTPRAIAHAKRMLAAGCDGVTIFGTTGEGPAFSLAERQALLESLLGSGVRADQIVVTTTALALPDVITLGRHAARLGVFRQMLMPPFFFNQPRDSGVVEAFSHVIRGIADDRVKIILYHFPAMCTYGFSHAAIAELVRRHPTQVIGIKDSGGDLDHALALAKAFPGFAVLVGSEPHVAPVMLVGGAGSINGLTNIAPNLMRRVIERPTEVSASDLQLMLALLALLSVLPGMPFVGVYKMMLAEQTGDSAWTTMRVPLSPLTETEEQTVRRGYRAIGALLKDI